ncbi:hypothetical protein BC830DRAFT_1149435 [Chytriomyces sp. MP71]|nr:hypothetical protein BC830DRAFT_1149435 [Chytriomyces sp. MP71]
MSLSLYRNSSGKVLSVSDRVRRLHEAGDIQGIKDQFSADLGLSSTTLCCVTPVSTLLEQVSCNLDLRNDEAVLSIGSGSGLFELLLSSFFSCGSVIGVDVAPINLFLPSASFFCIQTDEDPSLVLAGKNIVSLLSVYMRRPSLLQDYLQWFPNVRKVVLVGPRSEDPLLDGAVADFVTAVGFTREILTVDVPGVLARGDMLQVLIKE